MELGVIDRARGSDHESLDEDLYAATNDGVGGVPSR